MCIYIAECVKIQQVFVLGDRLKFLLPLHLWSETRRTAIFHFNVGYDQKKVTFFPWYRGGIKIASKIHEVRSRGASQPLMFRQLLADVTAFSGGRTRDWLFMPRFLARRSFDLILARDREQEEEEKEEEKVEKEKQKKKAKREAPRGCSQKSWWKRERRRGEDILIH